MRAHTHNTNHIFFIRFSVNGLLDCFHVLSINSAAMNTGVHVSFVIIALSGYMPRSEIVRPHFQSLLFWS